MSVTRKKVDAILGAVLLVGSVATGCSEGPRPSDPRGHQALAKWINALGSNAIRQGPQPGASIAVASDGRVLLAKGYGMADVDAGVPATASTVYPIGSVTKQFTAAAVMDLAERGLLEVDGEVTRFLPDYPTGQHRLTVRHLLTHTSGLRNYTELPEFQRISNTKVPREQVISLFAGRFDFPPGQQWAYSNSNYYLLGLIVENTSGVPFSRYLSDRIFAPLGMRDTSYCVDDPPGRNHAQGYELGADDKPRPAKPLNMEYAFAAGGLCSTVEDLVTWTEAFHGHRFLTEDSHRMMTSPVTLENGTTFPYGSGLSLDRSDGPGSIAHDGAIPGFGSALAFFPEEKLTVAVLVNSSSRAGADLIAAVTKVRSPGCEFGAAPARRAADGPRPLANGGFETGDFSGWTVENQPGGRGDWFVYAGQTSPLSCTFLAAPPEGSNGATTESCGQFRPATPARPEPRRGAAAHPARCVEAEDGPGSHVLYQDITLPAAMTHELSFFVYYRNQAGTFASPPTLDYRGQPNQQFRVDLLKATADPFSVVPDDVSASLFRTNPGDAPILSATAKTFDLSPFAGSTVRLRFAEVDNLSMFQAAVDEVTITSRSR